MSDTAGFVHQEVRCCGWDNGYGPVARVCGEVPALLLPSVRLGGDHLYHAIVQPGVPPVDLNRANGMHDLIPHCCVRRQCISAETTTVITSFYTPRRLRGFDAHSGRVWDFELPTLVFPRPPIPGHVDCAIDLHCAFGLVAAVLASCRLAVYDLATGTRLGLSRQWQQVVQLHDMMRVAVLDQRTVATADSYMRRITLFRTNGTVQSTVNMHSFGPMFITGMVRRAPGELLLLDHRVGVIVISTTRPPVRTEQLKIPGVVAIAPRRDGHCALAIQRDSKNELVWAILHAWCLRTTWIAGCALLARSRTHVPARPKKRIRKPVAAVIAGC